MKKICIILLLLGIGGCAFASQGDLDQLRQQLNQTQQQLNQTQQQLNQAYQEIQRLQAQAYQNGYAQNNYIPNSYGGNGTVNNNYGQNNMGNYNYVIQSSQGTSYGYNSVPPSTQNRPTFNDYINGTNNLLYTLNTVRQTVRGY